MTRGLLFRLLLCIVALVFSLYASVNQQNTMTELSISLPLLRKEVKQIQDENACLRFQIDAFECPKRLMALLKEQEFSHLVYPKEGEVRVVVEPQALP